MFFKNLDFYGLNISNKVLGEETFKTWLGFFLSVITAAILCVFFILFGSDFFYKKNPKVISSIEFPSSSSQIFVNSGNFSLLWRIEDELSVQVQEEDLFTFMKVTYKMFKRDDQGDFVTVHDLSIDPKKCSLTRAAENPILENINLDHFYCVDFDEIKKKGGFETDVPLYGDYDEDVVSYIYFQGSNCQINTETDAIYDCLSLEEVTERNNRKSYQFVHLMLPRFNFRPASFEEPMSSYLESSFVKLSPFAFTTDEIRYSKVILENDVGWIFEDVQELFSAEKTQQNRSFNSIIADSYNLNDINLIYFADFMFTKKQLNYKRSYMKIQELAANVGGVSKFFVQFFGFISQQVGTLILDNKLIGIFFTDASTSRVINRIQLNRSSSNFEAERKKQVIKITFSHFLSTRICCKKKNAYAMAAEEVKSTFDVVEIYKNHLRVLYLSDVLLDEENKNKMDASLKRAIELSQEEEQPVMNESGEVVNAKRS